MTARNAERAREGCPGCFGEGVAPIIPFIVNGVEITERPCQECARVTALLDRVEAAVLERIAPMVRAYVERANEDRLFRASLDITEFGPFRAAEKALLNAIGGTE